MMTFATKPVISITPTFTLRRIQPKAVLQKYHAGGYADLRLPETKLRFNVVATTLQAPVGVNPQEDVCSLKLRNNTQQVVASSNCRAYTTCLAQGGTEVPHGGVCGYCNATYTTQSLGIPVRIYDDGTKTTYYLDDCQYDSFECVLAALKRHYGYYRHYRDPLYMDSEQMLRLMYHQVYPESYYLAEAPDSRLFKSRGGSISPDDPQNKKHHYIRTTNIVSLPVKVQYFREPHAVPPYKVADPAATIQQLLGH